jgi:hypothetical protein
LSMWKYSLRFSARKKTAMKERIDSRSRGGRRWDGVSLRPPTRRLRILRIPGSVPLESRFFHASSQSLPYN